MSEFAKFFEECAKVLTAAVVSPSQQVSDFLHALGYLPTVPAAPAELMANRLALLRLAGRFEQAFQLPMEHAPGAVFFGAMISPASIGVCGHGEDASGVGGRGETLRQAFEGCVGEAAEYLSFVEHDIEALICAPPPADTGLGEQGLAWALAGIGLSANTPAGDLDWIEARSLADDGIAYFPSELIVRRPEHLRTGKRQAESTGVGAGPTRERAITGALLEVVERDAVALWWFGGVMAGALSADLAADDVFRAFAERVRTGSPRPHWFLDLTSDLAIPVVAALSSEADGTVVIAGYAAGLTMHEAARSAFLEMCQMELAQSISVAKLDVEDRQIQAQDQIWIDRYRYLNTADFPQLTATGGEKSDRYDGDPLTVSKAIDRIHQAGFTPYAVDLNREQVAIPVSKVVVPGLQSAKPDWLATRLERAASCYRVDLSQTFQQISPV